MKNKTNRKKEETSIIWLISMGIFDISALAFIFLPFIDGNQTKMAIINFIVYFISAFYGVGKLLFEAMDGKLKKAILIAACTVPIILYFVIKKILVAM